MPAGVTQRDYLQMLRICRRSKARLCVDTSGPMLKAALSLGLWAIKPNRSELEELTGRTLRSTQRVEAAAVGLLEQCRYVLVSLGAGGALLVSRDGSWHAREKRPASVCHTVGCGDALFCGFLTAKAAGKPDKNATRFAVACGSACVRTPYAAIQSQAQVKKLLTRIHVEKL